MRSAVASGSALHAWRHFDIAWVVPWQPLEVVDVSHLVALVGALVCVYAMLGSTTNPELTLV